MTPPNRPGTPTTTFRLDPALRADVIAAAATHGDTLTGIVRWALAFYRDCHALIADARAKAAERGETLSDVVRRALREYVEEER